MKLPVALLLVCATLFCLGMVPGDANAQGQTRITYYVQDASGNPIVGAPVSIDGGATVYTGPSGMITTYAWCGCAYCLWKDSVQFTVYRKTYTIDTSMVICAGTFDRSYSFLVTHIPNVKPPCTDCYPEDPAVPENGAVSDHAGHVPMTWSMVKALY